jgi:hypothetical protein
MQRTGQNSGQNHLEPHPATRAEHLLDEDWDQAYTESLHWGEIWIETHTDDEEWPVGYRVIKSKPYKGMEICIPEIYALEIVV